jgi:hypothetical protein
MSTKQFLGYFVRRDIIASDAGYTAHSCQVRKYVPIYKNLLVASNLLMYNPKVIAECATPPGRTLPEPFGQLSLPGSMGAVERS